MSNIQFYNGEYLQTWTDSQTTVRFMPSDRETEEGKNMNWLDSDPATMITKVSMVSDEKRDCQGPNCSEKGTYGYVEHEGRKIDLCERCWGQYAGRPGWSDAGRYGEERT